ncbi:family 2 glycosyl transferase [Leptolyngbya boryana NIES-2135]|jgi:glycosyltransferase involved in cell wall biosynthesis|uniref:Family 2 glycosyl transferase n=1 Tax=Leptolyngbya boryana NIES-2135 TaxID=1973484 RepID=A0A1Z4JAB7_LEPBY|nr:MULTISPECIES: glycosyltransferase family 2 protein [Leptolyngbya]BAY53377.1 family 2 glycosyl transferase [Leptolyngbya boryana NIES-2135]MBD2366758.1 glycosyltransferase family 2 protein [Leptolyngbya sp. FACHB-161]MBD2373227.1 glycosyltransferase family 2 protein [Leptolyngbya sp. FACHB-238]MBD2397628.1 glycosyltransferase family 2 protein [Leptolyngbya sp. FACHB-239]MBD2404772.1 glycosyltransferase family 2 protein [Leptolyngbya sp. FACHB-402]
MASEPLVSVVIAAYNAEAFISDTIKSLQAQTYRNFEAIIVDDGSQDRTAEIVRSFARNDDRIKLIQQPNAGVPTARNLAIQHSSGEYIAPIDADDIWYPERLAKHVHCLETADANVGLVYSWSVYLNEKGEIKGYSPFGQLGAVEGNVLPMLVFYNFLDNACSTTFRRECLDRVGYYNCEFETCEDWDLYLRIAESYQFRIVPEYLIGYRQYSGSMSTKCVTMSKFYELIMSRVYQRHPELPQYVRHWANTAFYNNLLSKSYLAGDYRLMFRWMFCSLRNDYALLLRPGIYKVTLIAIVKTLLKPFLIPSKPTEIESRSVIDQNQPDSSPEPNFWKPYDLVIQRRWQHVLKTTQI